MELFGLWSEMKCFEPRLEHMNIEPRRHVGLVSGSPKVYRFINCLLDTSLDQREEKGELMELFGLVLGSNFHGCFSSSKTNGK